MSTALKRQASWTPSAWVTVSLSLLALFALIPASASASKEVVAAFGEAGTEGGQFETFASAVSGYSDVNGAGAGPADPGDFYIADRSNDRIQRFSRNDQGTPAEPYDDTFEFVSAWGADVDATPAGVDDYEICTVAEECKEGVASGGNGTAAGNGALARPLGVAVDEDTGQVYVGDTLNHRVNVYAGDGVFLRSFGFDVVASGPGDNGTGYEVCVAADGDVCKAGTSGGGIGQLGASVGAPDNAVAVSQADGDPASGTVFVTDSWNSRVNTYGLDGSTPSSFGSTAEIPTGNRPFAIAVDSRGIVYLDRIANGQEVVRYDSENANGDGVGFLAPIPTVTVAVNGGPGNATGSNPYTLTFRGALGETDVSQISVSNGSTPLSGGSGATVTTISPGGPGADEVQRLTVSATNGQFRLTFEGQTTADLPYNADADRVRLALMELSSVPDPPIPASSVNGTMGLAVDPDSDGGGPDEDVLYALRTESPFGDVRSRVYQVGPVNDPGLLDPPVTHDDVHGRAIGFTWAGGFGIDRDSGRLFVSTSFDTALGYTGTRVYVLDNAGGAPSGTIDSVSDITSSSATVNATVNPNGPPPTSIHLEYSLNGSDWTVEPSSETVVGSQTTPQSVGIAFDPPGTGLSPGTEYHVRGVIVKAFSPPVTTPALAFTTLPSPPEVETVGSPVRGATDARLEGRVNPRGAATSYHFEYGTSGPCSSNPCQSTDPLPVGAGTAIRLVSQQVEGLSPSTTYHHRLVADNGVGGSPVFGEDMTLTTRASDQLTPPEFPGPVGSDRAWELVSLPDSGGNPIPGGISFSDDGERVVYQNSGGSPSVDSGSFFSMLFAERTESGWRTTQLAPSRDEVIGPNWLPPTGTDDLSELFAFNFYPATQEGGLWRLRPGTDPVLLHHAPPGQYGGFYAASDDGSRKLAVLKGSVDPAHPSPPDSAQLYDVSGGTPQLVSLLPGDAVPSCGVVQQASSGLIALPTNAAQRRTRWLSPDGSLLLFPSQGNSCGSVSNLYLRNLETEETARVSTPPVTGPLCDAEPLKQTPGAVFFYTSSRLVAEDAAPDSCSVTVASHRDVYRYDVEGESLECVTCLSPGLRAEVDHDQAAVAADGSRVYFRSSRQLLPGAVVPAVYRVEVDSGELAYVAPIGSGKLGESAETPGALSPDGSVLIFRSASSALDAVNGPQNGGTAQYYRYDDQDRSLLCVSCPTDGAPAKVAASATLAAPSFTPEVGPNADPLDDTGKTFIFATPNSLVSADQNTAEAGQEPARGQDVYEWRDGRILLVSDGLTNWPRVGVAPTPNGVSADGRDVFFTASIQYTPDALDSYNRLYDARIGGGFEFPPPPKPCPLEVCQGTPKGAPDKAGGGTSAFVGPGNLSSAKSKPRRGCPKGKRKVRRQGKARCVKPRSGRKGPRRANHDRRTHR